MDLRGLVSSFGPDLAGPDLSRLVAAWTTGRAEKGTVLARQGERVTHEILILQGAAVSHIGDDDGRSVCVGFHPGPGIVTPHVARTRCGISLVSVEVTREATVAYMDADALMEMMLRTPAVRDWANGILRDELSRKTDREWCLAALGGADRLAWFRERYPEHESLFAHGHIASFLGMTPVTFSRLRNAG